MDQDPIQFSEFGRRHLCPTEGFLFVRFREETTPEDTSNASDDPIMYEHCVAEAGHLPGVHDYGEYVLWTCPCSGCDPWRDPKWKHLMATLWDYRHVYELVDSDYIPLSREQTAAMGLYDYMQTVGVEWECITWEDGSVHTEELEADWDGIPYNPDEHGNEEESIKEESESDTFGWTPPRPTTQSQVDSNDES